MTATKTSTSKEKKELADLVSQHTQSLQIDDLVEGEIVDIGKNSIFVDLGNRGTGIIFGREIKENRAAFKDFKRGDKISGVVAETDNEHGYIELSLKKAFREQAWKDLLEAQKEQKVISVKITAANRGGLIVNAFGLSGFLPVSQLASENYPRVEEGDKNKILQHLNKFVNKEMKVKVLDASPAEEKLIFSEKATSEQRLEEALKEYRVGDVVEGEISGVVDFGAFIKFATKNKESEKANFLEGLVHISELDWQLIENPRDVAAVGDRVKAKIIGIDNNRLSLSLKALKKDPWTGADQKYQPGQKIKGQVVKFNPFGAFVKLDKNIQGLVHISEFDNDPEKMRQRLSVGEKYDFQIASLDMPAHKMALSLAEQKEKTSKISKTPAAKNAKS